MNNKTTSNNKKRLQHTEKNNCEANKSSNDHNKGEATIIIKTEATLQDIIRQHNTEKKQRCSNRTSLTKQELLPNTKGWLGSDDEQQNKYKQEHVQDTAFKTKQNRRPNHAKKA